MPGDKIDYNGDIREVTFGVDTYREFLEQILFDTENHMGFNIKNCNTNG